MPGGQYGSLEAAFNACTAAILLVSLLGFSSFLGYAGCTNSAFPPARGKYQAGSYSQCFRAFGFPNPCIPELHLKWRHNFAITFIANSCSMRWVSSIFRVFHFPNWCFYLFSELGTHELFLIGILDSVDWVSRIFL